MKKQLKISKKDFCLWYFDCDTREDLGKELVAKLIENGEVSMNLDDITSNLGYIPLDIIKNTRDIDADDIDDDRELSSPDKYKIILVN